ncbi:unnamed protein product, partial [Iphiclides podalirius]
MRAERNPPSCDIDTLAILFHLKIDHLGKGDLGKLYAISEVLKMPGITIEAWHIRKGQVKYHWCQSFGHSGCAREHLADECLNKGQMPKSA